jgi:spore maturation protein CgeB
MNYKKLIDIAFIGTCRDKQRYELVQKFAESGKYVDIFGNNWDFFNPKMNVVKPVYFKELNKTCNSSKIVISQHFYTGPSTHDFEFPACGGALMISDYFDGIKDIYPNVPIYKNANEAVELARYYLEHEEERQKLVDEMQQQAYQYSYKSQLKKLLDEIIPMAF